MIAKPEFGIWMIIMGACSSTLSRRMQFLQQYFAQLFETNGESECRMGFNAREQKRNVTFGKRGGVLQKIDKCLKNTGCVMGKSPGLDELHTNFKIPNFL